MPDEKEIKLYLMVCSECGRQVNPHHDHNLGYSRTVYCAHGKLGPGCMEQVTWERIEVIPRENVQILVDEFRKRSKEAAARLGSEDEPAVKALNGVADRIEEIL